MYTRHKKQNIETLSYQFKEFGMRLQKTLPHSIYIRLSENISKDVDLLNLSNHVRKGQLAPNIFFAAVQYLLLDGYEHDLGKFYNVRQPQKSLQDDPFPYLKSFCKLYEKDLKSLISTRLVQTNEVGRSASLPFCIIKSSWNKELNSVRFIDVGASIGFNLFWDKYSYDYGEHGKILNENSQLKIKCELKNENKSFSVESEKLPLVVGRVGIDIDPPRINDQNSIRWIKSLIPPDDYERHKLFDLAFTVTQKMKPKVLSGDARVLFPQIISKYKDRIPALVFFSYSANQIFPDGLDGLLGLLKKCSGIRPIYSIVIGFFGDEFPRIELIKFCNGKLTRKTMGHRDMYCEWIDVHQ